MIRGLIFDFDGLICDTEGPAYQSWCEVYAAHGCALPMDAWVDCLGRALGAVDFCGLLETQVGRPIDRVKVFEQRQQRKAELASTLPTLPGIREYLTEAQHRGLGLAVASSSPRQWVMGHLDRLGIAEMFACVKSADDVTHAKPHPDLYEAALAGLGLAPDEAIAFEDSPNGIIAAKAAGLFCVAVPNAVTRQLTFDAADLCVESLATLPLATLLSHVASR